MKKQLCNFYVEFKIVADDAAEEGNTAISFGPAAISFDGGCTDDFNNILSNKPEGNEVDRGREGEHQIQQIQQIVIDKISSTRERK